MKHKLTKKILAILLLLVMALSLAACTRILQLDQIVEKQADIPSSISENQVSEHSESSQQTIEYGQIYTSKDQVATYLYEYKELPPNYITKNEAYDLGWEPEAGNLAEVAPGMSIGGDSFGNREGLLPEVKGRRYYEADIDYVDGTRNAKRIVYSNDGLIFFTDDHYASFKQLY